MTVTSTIIMVADAMCCLVTVSVCRIAKAKATAPRKPATNTT
jgi:hypothetical protein